MERPAFTPQMTVATFQAYYWTKQELQEICRHHGLPTTGTKAALNDVIGLFLTANQFLKAPRRDE